MFMFIKLYLLTYLLTNWAIGSVAEYSNIRIATTDTISRPWRFTRWVLLYHLGLHQAFRKTSLNANFLRLSVHELRIQW